MAYSDKEDRAKALKAVLDMIDSNRFKLETRDNREGAMGQVIEESDLTCWTGSGKTRRRVPYSSSLLLLQFYQLTGFLKGGVQKTKPKTEVIWRSGSSVIEPEYLRQHLGFNIDPAIDNNLKENRTQTADRIDILTVPETCSGISGSEDCEGPNPDKLYHAGDGGFYCRPCLKYAIHEEDSPYLFGGCSDPFRSPRCKGMEMDKLNFYSKRVLCSTCKNLIVKEEKNKAATAEARASIVAEESTGADRPESSRRGSNASIQIMRESNVPKIEQPLPMPQAKHAVVEKALPTLVDLDAVHFPGDDSAVDGSTQQSLTIHLKAPRLNGESQNQHTVSENGNTTTRKRSAETTSSHPVEGQHKRRRDELHQNGNTGVALAHIQKEMDAILELLREIVMIFHFVNQLDANEPARILERDELSRYPALMAAYLQTVGPDDRHWCELSLDNNLTSNGFLTALLGAMLYQQVFPVNVNTPCETCPASTIDALKADLRHSDDDWLSFQARLRFREVQSHAFQENITKTIAPDAAGKVIFALQPQFRHMTGANIQQIATSEWLTEFNEKLTKSIKRAFMLKARLQVAPERYEMIWFASDSYFERTMMDANGVPPDGDYRIAMTSLPGWKLKDPAGDESQDEVVVKATVRLDRMSGPRE